MVAKPYLPKTVANRGMNGKVRIFAMSETEPGN